MADHILHPLFELDVRDPSFGRAHRSWAMEARRDIDGMVADTELMIARTKGLLAKADLIMAQQTSLSKLEK